MTKQRGTSGGGVIAIAAIAFVLGRCSVQPSEAVQPSVSAQVEQPSVNDEVAVTATGSDVTDAESTSSSEVQGVAGLEPATEESPETISVYYGRCADARAAGAAPIHVGEPGYASHLDRDGDGIACE